MSGFVYILASGKLGTLYVGVTSDLARWVFEHRDKAVPGFTERHGVTKLVYYERHDSIGGAIVREKQIKRWERDFKIRLIESLNPSWDDLYESLNR